MDNKVNVADKTALVDVSKQDNSSIRRDWEEFFRRIHKMKTDFCGIPIPEDPGGDFPFIICKPEKLTYEQAFWGGKNLPNGGGNRIKKFIEASLDDAIDNSFGRDARKDSFIVRISKDALSRCSAIDIVKKGIVTSTLMESLLFRDFNCYYRKIKGTSIFLNSNYTTWCPGSRLVSYGWIPALRWNATDKELKIFPMEPNSSAGIIVARKVLTN
jgi:hypothetical protein